MILTLTTLKQKKIKCVNTNKDHYLCAPVCAKQEFIHRNAVYLQINFQRLKKTLPVTQ